MILDVKDEHGVFQLCYQWIDGDPSKPIILFLHEGLGSIKQWKSFPKELCSCTGFPGLVYEREGYGNSSPLRFKRDENYLHNYALTELPLLVEALLPERDIIIFGHSDGGTIAYLYAAHYPTYVKALITEAAHVFVEDVTLEGINPIVEAFRNTDMKKKLSKYHGDKTEQIFFAWADTWHLKKFRDWNIAHCLPQITVPSLVIQGEDDEYGTEAQVDSIVNNTNGRSIKLMLPNCGHVPHKDAREEVLLYTTEFIKGL